MNSIYAIKSTRRSTTDQILLVVCLAQFMVILDVGVVNVALPAMHRGLGFSTVGLQWVVNAYTLTFAGFMMLGGRCADLLGRRRVFLAGVALFSASSLVCALAGSRGVLIGARALQGFSGAIVSPASLSFITASLPEGRERTRGLGLWAAVSGLGASSGALLGGVLTQGFGWPAIFAVNLPLGAAVIGLGFRALPGDGDREGVRHFDVAGALLVTLGLASLTYGIVRTSSLEWGSPQVLSALGAALALLGSFAFVERRIASRPLVPFSIFRTAQLRAANLIVVLLYFALFSTFFFVTLYLQQVLGQDPLRAGLSFLPMTLSVFTASSLAPRLIDRWGVRSIATSGMLLAAAGLALLTGLHPAGSYFTLVLPGAIVAGLGMGLALVSSTVAATQGIPRDQSGLASGLLNMSRLFGGALGLAVLSTIAANASGRTTGVRPDQAMTDGFGVALLVGAAVALVGAFLAWALLRPPALATVTSIDRDEVASDDEAKAA